MKNRLFNQNIYDKQVPQVEKRVLGMGEDYYE